MHEHPGFRDHDDWDVLAEKLFTAIGVEQEPIAATRHWQISDGRLHLDREAWLEEHGNENQCDGELGDFQQGAMWTASREIFMRCGRFS